MCWLVRLFAPALLAATTLSSQSSVQSADPAVRITSNLVQVDVVVTDSKGRQVTDLRPDEFEIQEDGKRESITSFAYVSPPTRRTFVFILDDIDSSGGINGPLRSSLQHFVDRWMQPGDMVSIVPSQEGTGQWQQLTNDRQRVSATIVRTNRPDRLIVSGAPNVYRQENAVLRGDAPGQGSGQPFLYGVASFEALRSAIVGLAGLPGRKTVVMPATFIGWTNIGEGHPAVKQLADLANRSGITIHVLNLSEIDTRDSFLGGSQSLAVDVKNPESIGSYHPRIPLPTSRAGEFRRGGADYLARVTGGISPSFVNNSLAKSRQRNPQLLMDKASAFLRDGLEEIVSDANGAYFIGYRPPQSSLQSNPSEFHSIKVSVRRKGLKVHSRTGYFGAPGRPAAPGPQSREELLQAALRSPLGESALRVRMNPFHSAAAKDFLSGERRPTVRALLAIDARDLRFEDQGDGTAKVTVDLLAAAYGVETEPVARAAGQCSMLLAAPQLKDLDSRSLLCALQMTLDRPGPYIVRVAARDRATDKIGSAYALARVPNYSVEGLTISSLELAALRQEMVESAIRFERVESKLTLDPQQPAAPASPALPEQDEIAPRLIPNDGNPMERVFEPGTTVVYSCYLFGAALDRVSGKPKLEAELYLTRIPRRALGFSFQTPPMPVRIEETREPFFIRGRIALPEDLEPGDYHVRLTMLDVSSRPDPRSGYRWTAAAMDFTVAKPGSRPEAR